MATEHTGGIGLARADGESHHALAAHEVLLLLETDRHDGSERVRSGRRSERYGPNVLPEVDATGRFERFIRQFHHPLIYVLLAAGR